MAKEEIELFRRAVDTYNRRDLAGFLAVWGDRVFLLTVEHLMGRDGIEVKQPAGGIFTFRAGKIARIEVWWDRRTALSAAGLSE